MKDWGGGGEADGGLGSDEEEQMEDWPGCGGGG